jgi:hypothetical protein
VFRIEAIGVDLEASFHLLDRAVIRAGDRRR